MKFLKFSILVISGLVGLYYYLVIKGGPINRTIEVNNCKADYTYYITDNRYEMDKTHGHSFNNNSNICMAKINIGNCLCDTYLKNKTAKDSIEILNILTSREYNYYFNFRIEDSISSENICKNKESHFGTILID